MSIDLWFMLMLSFVVVVNFIQTFNNRYTSISYGLYPNLPSVFVVNAHLLF